MKKIFFCLIILLTLTGCGNNTIKEEVKMIKSDELKAMLKDETKKVFIVDVRTYEEYNQGHIKDALNVSVDLIEARFAENVTEDKDAHVIVYCRSGSRSKEASNKLVKLGYKNVYDLGGIGNWDEELVR